MTVACSVLYRPFSELDLDEPYGAPPESAYFGKLIELLEASEREIEQAGHTVVRSAGDLQADGIKFVHCVEGGFHLGATPAEVDANVRELARRGVLYITLAHLFYRQVATNAPALPFLPDPLYNVLFPQHGGLTPLGEAAVKAMNDTGIIVDISHMSEPSIDATFNLLDGDAPVIASHAGYRFGGQKYNLTDGTIARIAARGGVVGLIFAQHQINDGLRRIEHEDADAVARRARPAHRRDRPRPRGDRLRPRRLHQADDRRRRDGRGPQAVRRGAAGAAPGVGGADPQSERAAGDQPAFRQRNAVTPRISRHVVPPATTTRISTASHAGQRRTVPTLS